MTITQLEQIKAILEDYKMLMKHLGAGIDDIEPVDYVITLVNEELLHE